MSKSAENDHIMKSASLVSVGTFFGSLLGMVRQIIVARLGSDITGPFFSALSPAQTFNDLLVNGAINGALVPTFNDYAAPEKRADFERLLFTLVNLILLIGAGAALLFLVISPWFVTFINPAYQAFSLHIGGQTVNQETLAIHFSQIIFFSLLGLGPFAIIQAALYARKEFGWPALAPMAYHLGIIMGAILASFLSQYYLGYYALAVGVAVGSFGEVALLVPALRKLHLHYRFIVDLKHPALRHLLRLYAPIALSYLVSNFFVYLDLNWTNEAPGNPAANLSAMRWATQLYQFPTGLVAFALSSAVLPTLAECARSGNSEKFKGVLLLGYRISLLLMIPATAGLIMLGYPIIALLFQHGSNTAINTQLTYLALQNYSYQLPFLAIDQLLLVAFFARKDTVKPVVVGFVGYIGYLAVAIPLRHTVGMPALAFANTVQNALRPIMLIVLLRLAIGPLRIREMIPATMKICVATGVMIAIIFGLEQLTSYSGLLSQHTLFSQLLAVLGIGGIATIVYFGMVALLKVEEITIVKKAVSAKFSRKSL
ncbi:MAG: lipid II flippase MurJ [Ktedonobacteraceae bacterium]